MRMYVLHECIHAVPKEARRGQQMPRTGVRDSCKLPCGCWESAVGPLQKPPVLLIAESFLQLLLFFI